MSISTETHRQTRRVSRPADTTVHSLQSIISDDVGRLPRWVAGILPPQYDQESFTNFDLFTAATKFKDYYKTLEVDYDATDDDIRANYIRLALKWHPDKQKDQDVATSRFQEINEAYQVLSDPIKRREYDNKGMLYKYDYTVVEYLNRFKGLILTCNGLGIKHPIW